MNEYQQMIRDCMARESKLSDWERSFIDSLDHRLSGGKPLTDSQKEKLDQIWERVT